MATTRTNKPSKGRDLPIPKKIKLAKQVCELYSTDLYTLESCLNEVGIKSDSTWYRWVQEIEEIELLYKSALKEKENNRDNTLVARAMTVFENALQGQKITLVERVGEVTQQDGQELIVTKTVKEKQIYIPPSLRAAEFIIINLKGDKFSRNPEPYKLGNTKYPDKLDVEIINPIKPVTSEDDIAEPNI